MHTLCRSGANLVRKGPCHRARICLCRGAENASGCQAVGERTPDSLSAFGTRVASATRGRGMRAVMPLQVIGSEDFQRFWQLISKYSTRVLRGRQLQATRMARPLVATQPGCPRHPGYPIWEFPDHHPLITPIGRIRATFFDSPAACTTSTTRSTFLYASGCSSASPFQLRARAITPRFNNS